MFLKRQRFLDFVVHFYKNWDTGLYTPYAGNVPQRRTADDNLTTSLQCFYCVQNRERDIDQNVKQDTIWNLSKLLHCHLAISQWPTWIVNCETNTAYLCGFT